MELVCEERAMVLEVSALRAEGGSILLLGVEFESVDSYSAGLTLLGIRSLR